MIGPDLPNVRGLVGGRPLYGVRISLFALQRAQALSLLDGATPADMTWFVTANQGTHVEIATTHPVWFAELDRKIEDAKRT